MIEWVVPPIIGILLVYGLAYLARKAVAAAAIAIQMNVEDDRTSVTANGELLLDELSCTWYLLNQGFGLPRLVERDVANAHEYRFADPQEEPPAAVVQAFVTACCLRARKKLGVSQMRPLRLDLVVALSETRSRTTFLASLKPERLVSVGVHLTVIGSDHTVARVDPPAS
jgi:hypothetical protein